MKTEQKKRTNWYGYVCRCVANPLSEATLRVDVKGNLPESSFIAVPHHQMGLDPWIVGNALHARFGKTMHFWVQLEDVYSSAWGKLLNRIESIPISVNGSPIKAIREAEEKSMGWLGKTEEGIIVFIDGPSIKSVELDKRGNVHRVIPLEERMQNYTPSLLSIKSGKPIVPIAEWCDPKYSKRLWTWGVGGGRNLVSKKLGGIFKITGNLIYMLAHRPIEYRINIGTPQYPLSNDSKGSRELRERVKQEQLRLYREIKGD